MNQDLEKAKQLREVERKGRISVQQKSRETLSQSFEETGYRFKAIATMESPFLDRRGTPRQPLLVRSAKGKIRFKKQLIQHDFFKELENFSHVWIIFVFHCNTNVDSDSLPAKIKPPRLKGAKVGCLSTRSPHRPNNIGLSVCEICSIGSDFIEISGVDLVNGTPILDIKPYVPCDSVPLDAIAHLSGSYAACLNTRPLVVPSWIVDEDVPYRTVTYDQAALLALSDLALDRALRHCDDASHAQEFITQVLRQDIRGIHQGRNELKSRDNRTARNNDSDIYECNLDNMCIKFVTLDNEIRVISIDKLSSS